MAQVCLSCPGVCVRHWFGVGAFAWCEYFLGSCVFFPGVGVLLSRLESCMLGECKSSLQGPTSSVWAHRARSPVVRHTMRPLTGQARGEQV